METCFLLTGKPRVGKSTAIVQLINRIGAEHVGGFYTEEIRSETDRIGFNCVTLDGVSKRIASVDSTSSIRIGRYGVELEAFENLALTSIRHSLKTKKVTVIDEIGYMQMLSVPFRKMVYDMVSSSQHLIIGTICLDSHSEIDKIKELPGIKLYVMNEENRELTTEALANDLFRVL